jgi:hypothetical protein
MKKRTLNEEINRIKKLNELFADDNDDYLYDPEYYEKNMEDDEDETDPQYDENGELIEPSDFNDDLTLGPSASSDTSTKMTEPEMIETPKNGLQHYDKKKTDQLHDILLKGDLEKDMIDEPVLQSMIKDFLVKPTADFGHDRRFGKDKRLFGFNKAKRGRDEINPTKDYGYADITPANRSIIEDKNKFHIYINNLIDINNKKLDLNPHKDKVNDIENEFRNRWGGYR